MSGEIGEEGSLFLKIYEKTDGIIKSNGPGYVYIYNLYGKFLIRFWGNKYHGVYFTDSPTYLGRINFKEGETKGDPIAKYSKHFISDSNIAYLKEMQKKCNSNNREYGGLVSSGGTNGELVFEECTWCTATSTTLDGILSIANYPNYKDKDFVSVWHTHPYSGDEQTQYPSGLLSAPMNHDYTGDFFLFQRNSFIWQGTELGESASAENTWSLPGRIAIIAGELGITIYRPVGNYYNALGSPSGYYSCAYHPKNLCYLIEGAIGILEFEYSWITYDLSQKKP